MPNTGEKKPFFLFHLNVKACTDKRNWTELTWFRFWQTDQRANRKSL